MRGFGGMTKIVGLEPKDLQPLYDPCVGQKRRIEMKLLRTIGTEAIVCAAIAGYLLLAFYAMGLAERTV